MKLNATFLLSCLGILALQVRAEQITTDARIRIQEAAPRSAQAKPKQTRRVLIWNTPQHLMEKDPHKGYCIPYGTAALEALGSKTGAYEPVVSDDLASFLPENIRTYDAIVMNNSSGQWITPTASDMNRPVFQKYGASAEQVEQVCRRSLLTYVENGGGLVLLHFAVAANPKWPEFKELAGGTFIGHPWNEEIGVRIEDPDSPLVAAFHGRNFRIADEIYEYGPPYDRSKLRVLMSLDPARSNMGVKWIHRKDSDFALAWVKSVGKGRVFNTSFGHRTELFWNPAILKFYLDAIQFAVGDLAAATDPLPPTEWPLSPGTEPARDLPGFVSLFNGRDLSGWNGDQKIWSVRNGILTGETTEQVRVTENNFLLWKDEVEDFELRLKFRLTGGNSGIYYRARKRSTGESRGEALVGAQADFSADGRWTGVMMEYTLREVLCERGQKVLIHTNGVKEVVGTLGDAATLLSKAEVSNWCEYHVTAKGPRVSLAINGVPMCEVEDNDPKRLMRGWLALQVHAGPPMRVEFKDIYLKRL